MTSYLLRRLIGAALVVFCVITISFVIMRLSPGSAFDQDKQLPPVVVANQAQVMGMAFPINAPQAGTVAAVSVKNGQDVKAGARLLSFKTGKGEIAVNAPDDLRVFRVVRRVGEKVKAGQALVFAETSLWTQYWTSIGSMLRLDFGVTFQSQGQRSVMQNIRETLPVSMELGLYALFFALLIGVPAGLIAGIRRNTLTDYSVMSVVLLGISIPSIVVGPLLILLFVTTLQWFPPQGGWPIGLLSGWDRKLLPALSLGLVYAAYFARLARGGMVETASQDWIRTARAKGLPGRMIIWRHAFRSAILPVVSYLGPATAHLLVGSVVIETVFNIPGVSKYFVASALNRDYPMVMGVVVLYSVLLVLFNLLVDLAYGLLDPRVRHG